MSAFIVNRDTIDLLVTLAVTRRIGMKRPEPAEVLTATVEHADHYGRLLWEANRDAFNQTTGQAEELPAYEWLPVMELIVGNVTPEQLVQIERSRRTLIDQSNAAPEWEGSQARRFLELLGQVIERGLSSWTRIATLDRPARSDYAGIRAAEPHWTRDDGLPIGTLFDDAAN